MKKLLGTHGELTTDEERQELCADLRNASDMNTTHGMRIAAANEIERLAALAKSDAKRIIELENDLFEARERLRYLMCR